MCDGDGYCAGAKARRALGRIRDIDVREEAPGNPWDFCDCGDGEGHSKAVCSAATGPRIPCPSWCRTVRLKGFGPTCCNAVHPGVFGRGSNGVCHGPDGNHFCSVACVREFAGQ